MIRKTNEVLFDEMFQILHFDVRFVFSTDRKHIRDSQLFKLEC